MAELEKLLAEVRACRLCEKHLPLGPRPTLRVNKAARVMIVGQAPGTKVHETGIPWNDPSGDRLRGWMQVERDTFYDESRFAIIPVGFCYPGRGKGGDLPPRPECAPKWHPLLAGHLPHIELVILCGQYAHEYYLGGRRRKTLAETVRHYKDFGPRFFPLPHPSPRNMLWFKKNPWLEVEVIPALRERLARTFSCI